MNTTAVLNWVATPPEWRAWALEHGSQTLQRAVREDYPHKGLLRRELIDALCPQLEGMERSADLAAGQCTLRIGAVREPNAASFEKLDRIEKALIAIADKLPRNTSVTVGQVRRLQLFIEGDALEQDIEVHAAGAVVEIKCGKTAIDVTYIWGRSDDPKEEG